METNFTLAESIDLEFNVNKSEDLNFVRFQFQASHRFMYGMWSFENDESHKIDEFFLHRISPHYDNCEIMATNDAIYISRYDFGVAQKKKIFERTQSVK